MEQEYTKNYIEGYILKEAIDLSPEEQRLSYYETAYKKYFHRDFDVHTIDQHHFTPFGRTNHFNDVTRKSKELRDRFLLKQIEAQLKIHHRILEVYGGLHVLAIEPALKQMMSSY